MAWHLQEIRGHSQTFSAAGAALLGRSVGGRLVLVMREFVENYQGRVAALDYEARGS